MKAFLLSFLLAFACAAGAQNRTAELDRAVAEARTAYNALQEAIARRDGDEEPVPGERNLLDTGASAAEGGTAIGLAGNPGIVGQGTPVTRNCAAPNRRCGRLNAAYVDRQAALERDVQLAQQRYDAALKRWNYLK